MKNNPCTNIPYNYKTSHSENLKILQERVFLDGAEKMGRKRHRSGLEESGSKWKRKLSDSTALEPTICGK